MFSVEQELQRISENLVKNSRSIKTEEATKNASILPFFRMLGFDLFDPTVVIPEFTADVGNKKGEKVDYALRLSDGSFMLVECKSFGAELTAKHHGQLHRYFGVTDAKFALLTNGQDFWFFTDLEKSNVMDAQPFFRFDILDYSNRNVREVQKFHQSEYNEESILNSAERLKYVSLIKSLLREDLEERPSEEYVKYVASQVYDGRLTASAKSDDWSTYFTKL